MKMIKIKRQRTLSSKMAGVLSFETSDITILPNNHGLVLRGAPSITFKMKDFLRRDTISVQVLIEIESDNAEFLPTLSLDYGFGHSKDNCFRMQRETEARWSIHVPLPQFVSELKLEFEPATEQKVVFHAFVVQRSPVTELIRHFHTINEETRFNIVGARLTRALKLLGDFHQTIMAGNEPVNHAAIASSLAIGLLKPINESSALTDKAYLDLIDRFETLDERDHDHMNALRETFSLKPKFSILMPVYDPPLHLLDEAIDCLIAQTYADWELCIADDASPNPAVREQIEQRSKDDPRIKYVFRETNGHISEATNSAAGLATGDFIVLMDNDDIIPPHALWTAAYYINRNPDCQLLFSDEDKINLDGDRAQPYFKGEFDRFLLYGHNMFSHLGIYRKALFEDAGKFRRGYEGSQDYDLTLRCIERCSDSQIVHIPHVLYQWRQIPGSTSISAGQKSYAFIAALRAINDHFQRCGYPLESVESGTPGIAAIRTLSVSRPQTISIVIPTRNRLCDLKPCIESIRDIGDPLLEIVIVDNGSDDTETLNYIQGLNRLENNISVVQYDRPFNFSEMCNAGVARSSGEIICLLNNDTEVLTRNMFARIRAWLSIDDIGIVGARLLYPNRSIQHFGVVTGVGEHKIAAHAYHGLGEYEHMNFSKSILVQQFSAVTAACFAVRKAHYLRVDGFDPSFAVAYNDVDFCLKIRESGLKIICDPEIKLLHKESQTRGLDSEAADKRLRLDAEAQQFIGKWGEDALTDDFYSPNFSTRDARFTFAETPRLAPPWKAGPAGQETVT
jgi:GT2 family glycosyltransferase